ncbi:hypothetical protein NE865_08358 [Phthorimaea operculella]|nr:hypothetical protein NE865_08358 [Phthorimaea operculella]
MSTAKEPEKPDDLTDAQVRMIREMFSAKIKRPMSQCNLKYDGSQDFYTTEKFISSVTEYKALERITDEEALADISVLLEKEAAAWWGSVKAQIKTWKEFTDQFRQRFSDKPSYVVYQDIVNDKQGDDEPFDDFVQRKRMLFARLSPPGYNEKQQIDLIYGQMHPKLREKVPRSLLEDNYYLFTHVRKAEEQIKKEKEASLNIHNDTPQNTAEKQQRTRCGSSLSVGHVEESCAKAEISSQAIISVKLSQSLSEPISKVTLSNMVQDRQELEPPRRVTRSLKKKHSDVMQNMSTEQITVEPQKKQSKLSKSGKQGNSKVQVKSTRVTQSQNKPTEMSNVENLKEPTKTADKEDKVGVDKQIKHEDKVDSTAVPSTSWKLTPMPPFMPKMSCIGCGGKEQVGYYREVCPQCCSDEEKTKLDETFSPVIVIDIFDHLQEEVANIDDCEGFTPQDVEKLGQCLSNICSIEPSVSALEVGAASAPVSLHALHCLDTVHKEALVRHELLPPMFSALTSLAAACVEQPHGASARCLGSAAALYRAAPAPSAHMLPHLLQALHSAVQKCGQDKRRRNSEQPDETTQISSLLLQVLATGLPLARERPDNYKEFWETLPTVLHTFMFEPPVGGTAHAKELVVVIRDEVLRGTPRVPSCHIQKVLALIRTGSLHVQAPNQQIQNEQELREREEFARTCFETLLQFSMLEDIDSLTGVENDTDPLAIAALLDRFQEVISRYTRDDDNAEPLPRHQLSEISFVLKAIATLTESMKKAPPGKVDAMAWQKLIGLYPCLVRLAARAHTAGAGGALREALLQYCALLAAPT